MTFMPCSNRFLAYSLVPRTSIDIWSIQNQVDRFSAFGINYIHEKEDWVAFFPFDRWGH